MTPPEPIAHRERRGAWDRPWACGGVAQRFIKVSDWDGADWRARGVG